MEGDKGEEYQGFCGKAMPRVTDGHAQCLLFCAICLPGWQFVFGSCMDKGGCNWTCFFFGWLVGLMNVVPGLGWIYGIYWSCECKKWNEELNRAGTNAEPMMGGQ